MSIPLKNELPQEFFDFLNSAVVSQCINKAFKIVAEHYAESSPVTQNAALSAAAAVISHECEESIEFHCFTGWNEEVDTEDMEKEREKFMKVLKLKKWIW